jgi:hypothetical protein
MSVSSIIFCHNGYETVFRFMPVRPDEADSRAAMAAGFPDNVATIKHKPLW